MCWERLSLQTLSIRFDSKNYLSKFALDNPKATVIVSYRLCLSISKLNERMVSDDATDILCSRKERTLLVANVHQRSENWKDGLKPQKRNEKIVKNDINQLVPK